ncbi:heparinase II/III domain-containing protein [Oceanibaculum sp.]|uniref:heparinase II/III family protein n=1 Tax=Oceanibaculum sp. TaxID=1903597 RepID=UPI00258B76F1|nr:heparinase II/III family protein [Oceanibaculum sp.]MCH2393377.1 heparinase II/III family protein [Oceanibaculum sp.]
MSGTRESSGGHQGGRPGGLWRTVRTFAYGTPLYRYMLAGRVPDRIAAVPSDSWPGNSDHGRMILEGRFSLLGHVVLLSADPRDPDAWVPENATGDWQAALNGFAWLRDLRQVGGDMARRRARELVADWTDRYDDWDSFAWEADILGERIANWISHHDFFCASADDEFRARFLDSLFRQARHLGRVATTVGDGTGLVQAAKGLVYAGTALPEEKAWLALGKRLLSERLSVQILADGCHASRSPSRHLAVLRDLIDIRACLRASGSNVPDAVEAAIERMAAMLRALRHGDGGLALFNDSNEEDTLLIDAVLAQSEAKIRPQNDPGASGFHRLSAARTLLIVDAGRPGALDGCAHAGTLSFEMSVGKERLIVNCGAASGRPDWNRAQRATAAHSTLIVGDVNSAEILEDGTLARGPEHVTAQRQEQDGDQLIDASHDGYAERLMLTHQRRLFLSADGADVRGEDMLTGSGGERFAIRFHLHPKVKASLSQNGAFVLLRLPGGQGWRLRSAGAAMELADSVYLGQRGEMKRNQQIVLSGTLSGSGTTVKWALRREEKRAPDKTPPEQD